MIRGIVVADGEVQLPADGRRTTSWPASLRAKANLSRAGKLGVALVSALAFLDRSLSTISSTSHRFYSLGQGSIHISTFILSCYTRACVRPLIPFFPKMSTSSNRYELTTEQEALAEERRQRRVREKEKVVQQEDPRGNILRREWLKLADPQEESQRVKIMTWNVCTNSNSQIVFDIEGCVRCSRNVLFVSGS